MENYLKNYILMGIKLGYVIKKEVNMKKWLFLDKYMYKTNDIRIPVLISF